MAVISVAIAALLIASCGSHKGTFVLINRSSEPIAQAVVTVCGQTIELQGIEPGAHASGNYEVRADSHYEITIEFKSGRMLSKEVGYVASGLEFHDEIVVHDMDIVIADSKPPGNESSR